MGNEIKDDEELKKQEYKALLTQWKKSNEKVFKLQSDLKKSLKGEDPRKDHQSGRPKGHGVPVYNEISLKKELETNGELADTIGTLVEGNKKLSKKWLKEEEEQLKKEAIQAFEESDENMKTKVLEEIK